MAVYDKKGQHQEREPSREMPRLVQLRFRVWLSDRSAVSSSPRAVLGPRSGIVSFAWRGNIHSKKKFEALGIADNKEKSGAFTPSG